MDTLTDELAFAPIQALHRSRADQIHRLLRPDAAQGPPVVDNAQAGLEYAVAHHLLEGADAAARADDRAVFAWYRRTSTSQLAGLHTATTIGPRVVLSPDLTSLTHSAMSETPYYLLGAATSPAPHILRSLAAEAFATAVETGFGPLLAGHAAVICLLRRKSLGETLDSWTITRLPGTVFTDHVDLPAVLARDLIHEAGHNWLNDALTATGVKIDNTVEVYSPWKNTNRPAFGFLHACWAFPLTMIYTARILDQVAGPVRTFLRAYLNQQRELLAATDQDHARVLELVSDDDLCRRLRAIHLSAREL